LRVGENVQDHDVPREIRQGAGERHEAPAVAAVPKPDHEVRLGEQMAQRRDVGRPGYAGAPIETAGLGQIPLAESVLNVKPRRRCEIDWTRSIRPIGHYQPPDVAIMSLQTVPFNVQ
jgi:hypothetical protein